MLRASWYKWANRREPSLSFKEKCTLKKYKAQFLVSTSYYLLLKMALSELFLTFL